MPVKYSSDFETNSLNLLLYKFAPIKNETHRNMYLPVTLSDLSNGKRTGSNSYTHPERL